MSERNERTARMLALVREGPKVFPVDDLLAGLRDVKAHPQVLLPFGAGLVAITAAETYLASTSGQIASLVIGFAGFLATTFWTIGGTRIGLAIADGRKPRLDVMKQGGDALVSAAFAFGMIAAVLGIANFLVYVFSMFIIKNASLQVALALVPLAWMGLMYVSLTRTLRWAFAVHLIVDKRMNATRAMERSTAISDGQRHRLLGFVLLALLLNLLGGLLAGLGAIVTVPATMMGLARIYRRLNPKQASTGGTRPIKKPAPVEEA